MTILLTTKRDPLTDPPEFQGEWPRDVLAWSADDTFTVEWSPHESRFFCMDGSPCEPEDVVLYAEFPVPASRADLLRALEELGGPTIADLEWAANEAIYAVTELGFDGDPEHRTEWQARAKRFRPPEEAKP